MLTNKDYCDYETSIILGELGFPLKRMKVKNFIDGKFSDSIVTVLLYEAQKWLREEKNIIVYPEKNNLGWYYAIHYNVGKVHQLKYSEECDTYEESLSKGIDNAIKILKDSRKQSLELENTEYDYDHNVYHEEL